ncbi:MAG: hypothetical protein H6851_05105 [Geminicoccaceae bacterium]|nr:hypothetical protein [Geminicoccaceae bacterium]
MTASLFAFRLARLLPPGSMFSLTLGPEGIALELHTDDGIAVHAVRTDGDRLVIHRESGDRAWMETLQRLPLAMGGPGP